MFFEFFVNHLVGSVVISNFLVDLGVVEFEEQPAEPLVFVQLKLVGQLPNLVIGLEIVAQFFYVRIVGWDLLEQDFSLVETLDL